MKLSIIGTGNMAKGIATRALAGGYEVELHTREATKGQALAADLGSGATSVAVGSPAADIVILAIPYGEIKAVAEQYDGFKGKVVVDITNPVDFNTFQLIPAPGTSGAEEIAGLLPEATVVKAFNTTFAGTLLSGEAGGRPLDVFVAGDDADANAAVSRLVTDGGMRVIDVGPLSAAQHLEGFQLLHMAAQEQLGTGWMSAVSIVA